MENNKKILARMAMDIRLRGLSEQTHKSYTRYAGFFLEFCKQPADELDTNDARDYLIHLMQERRLSIATINMCNAAIRFLFAVTLNKTLNYLQLPRFKKPKTLPVILTREESHRLIGECLNDKHKVFFMLAYGSGLRVSEIAALRVKDIDSKAMRIFVRGGKCKKDRYCCPMSACARCANIGLSSARRTQGDGCSLALMTASTLHLVQ